MKAGAPGFGDLCQDFGGCHSSSCCGTFEVPAHQGPRQVKQVVFSQLGFHALNSQNQRCFRFAQPGFGSPCCSGCQIIPSTMAASIQGRDLLIQGGFVDNEL